MSGYYITHEGQVFRTMAGESTQGYTPVAVVAYEDRDQVEALYDLIFSTSHHPYWTTVQAALREFANPAPPAPEEPTGLGAVVEDKDGERWLRYNQNTGGWPWIHDGPQDSRKYAEIAAVHVLSDGVQP